MMHSANDKPLLVGVGGPTASGKTAASIALAKHFDTEIVSFDARQFYREMRIGTAVPTDDELKEVRHHFIRDRSVNEPLSAGRFAEAALKQLERLFTENEVVIAVGGSGLYWRALSTGLNDMPEIPTDIRLALQEEFKEKGVTPLQEELKSKDPAYYGKVDVQNPMRILRALEVIRTTGDTYSQYRNQPLPDRPFRSVMIGIDWQRETLYERINQRVDQMVADGLETEAGALLSLRDKTPLDTVGYKEWFQHFDGDLSRADAINDIKQHTRNYAKRQLTWFRKEPMEWFAPEDVPEAMIQWIETVHLDQR